jgi:hypothetical protein
MHQQAAPPAVRGRPVPAVGHRLLSRVSTDELAIGLVFALWSLVPFLVLFVGSSGVFNGSDGLQVGDHMQYLGFIRDAGEHVLFSNRMDVVPDPHLFLHPVDAISGLLWRLGASIQLAFLIWKPVAVAAVLVGFVAYVRRLLAPGRAAMAAALVLALFYFAPAGALAEWLGAGPGFKFGTLVVSLEQYVAGYTWGGFPGAIAVGCVPLYLLAAERLLDPTRRAPGRSARWYALAAGAAGLLAGWLHPWQGITLLVISAGLVAWGRFDRRYLALALPAAMTAAPLLYFWILKHTDSSWAYVSLPNNFTHLAWWLVVGLVPGLLALLGYPGRNLDLQERMLRLWPAAAVVVYFGLHSSWFYHAFIGVSLPLGILVVKGWHRLHLPRAVAVAAIAAVTIPGAVYNVIELRDARADHFFRGDERRALTYLDDAARPGVVLAPREPLGQAVPGFAGRNTYVGHYTWTPDYVNREKRATALFDGRMKRPEAYQLIRESRAVFLASDCRGRADLTPLLRPLLAHVQRIGCATVYELKGSPR